MFDERLVQYAFRLPRTYLDRLETLQQLHRSTSGLDLTISQLARSVFSEGLRACESRFGIQRRPDDKPPEP